MVIDDRIEALVREVLDAAVKRDLDRFSAALSAIPDGEDAAASVQLTLAICLYVLLETFDGVPAQEQIDEAGEYISDAEDWAQLNKSDVARLLRNITSEGHQFDEGLPVEEAMTLPFIIAANL